MRLARCLNAALWLPRPEQAEPEPSLPAWSRRAAMSLDVSAYQQGVPELVAAELVRDVVEPKEFDEFCRFDCVTVLNGLHTSQECF